jgi:hypothetical protein
MRFIGAKLSKEMRQPADTLGEWLETSKTTPLASISEAREDLGSV